jgi:hypothetical protein
LTSTNEGLEGQVRGLTPLPHDVAQEATRKRLKAVKAELQAVNEGKAQLGSEELRHLRYERDRLLAGADHFDAFSDGAEVVLTERLGPHVEGLAPPDPDRVYGMFGVRIAELPRDDVPTPYLRGIAESLPSDAVDVIERMEPTLHVNPLAESELNGLGPGHARFTRASIELGGRLGRMSAEDVEGHFVEWASFLFLRPLDGRAPPERTSHASLHESIHMLDVALGSDGLRLSDSPEWVAIFNKTKEWTNDLRFPTVHSSERPNELLAEAAAIFLRPAVTPRGVVTREDLREMNPDAYDFVRRMFTERIPQALRDGSLQEPTAPLFRSYAKAMETPEPERTPLEWLNLACLRFLVACVDRSAQGLDQAERDLAQAQAGLPASHASSLASLLAECLAEQRQWLLSR